MGTLIDPHRVGAQDKLKQCHLESVFLSGPGSMQSGGTGGVLGEGLVQATPVCRSRRKTRREGAARAARLHERLRSPLPCLLVI